MKKNYLLLKKGWILLLVLISSFAVGQTTVPYSAPGTYTFTVPAGVTSLKIEAWGAGSGGNNSNSRGGGGGAFAGNDTQAVTPGTVYTVIVGAGGAAGTGNSGQDSKFGSLVIAKGGNAEFGGLASASTGTVKFDGGNGGRSTSTGGAGGGGSAGSGGNGGAGGNTSNTNGGAGGAAGSGGGAAGGNGGSTNNNGSNGAFPGGGGGERGSNGTIGSGAGGDGQVIITYTPAYVAQLISASTGSTTWCAGETRNVTVTIKNIGSQPWTDVPGPGGKDFNIGIKWSQNATSWNDYNVRVDARNLAPGATNTYTFPITASNNVNGSYTTPLAAGTNNLTFDVVYEMVAWFGNNPAGSTGVGPGNNVFTTPAQTIVALPSAPTGISPSTGQTICSGSSVNLSATSAGNTIYWFTTATGGTSVGSSASGATFSVSPTVNTTYYAEARNASGCAIATRSATALITVNTTSSPTGTASQSFCSGASPTVANLQATGTAIKWYSAPIGGTALTATTPLANNTHYYASQTVNGCESTARFDVTATVSNPTTPSGSAFQYFCSGTGATVASLTATGTAVKWYAASTGGTALVATTPLATNTHYYASQTVNGCESTIRLDVTVTISPPLSAPTIGTITQPTCSTATGSVILNGLPTGSWSLTRSPGNVITTGTGTSTTISGLAAGTYTYSVSGVSNGLKGEYFNNMTLSGSPTLTRTDAAVNFDWGNGSPDASIPVDRFSVRWSGLVQPLYSETYTFSTESDDGIRLWVNGVQIINNWTDHGPTTDTGTISLTAGVKYSIVLEYYENGGGAVSKLSWNSASQSSQIIPTAQLFPAGSCASPASVNVVINAQPATPAAPTITAGGSTTFCAGGSVTLTSSAGTSYLWSNGATTQSISAITGGTYTVQVTNASGCQSASSTGTTVVVNALPATPTITAGGSLTFCAGGSVTLTSSTGTSYLWSNGATTQSISATAGGTYTVQVTNASGCQSASSAATFVTVNALPVITQTKVDETCPASHNGSITPVLSGGLTNIRYIKLTQKYVNADAWQQVAEIEAFEIFTGTNVARSTNGATASSSSNYSNDATNYGPQKAIDGNNSGNNNFWHSNSRNINEWIRVDLQSGKNLDNIKIYNRTDCCSERGQNMLLELFDTSNNLVYSKTIDLYQSGANVPVDINVLDVSWADNATTLIRTGLDAGTYTLNYKDAVGCSISSTATIGTTNTASIAPTGITGSFTICNGASTTLTLSGGSAGTGAVAQWFTGSCGGTLIGTGNSITVSPTATTTYYVRYSGTCYTTACVSQVVTVRSPFSSGTIDNTGQTVCYGGTPSAIGSTASASGGDGEITYSWRSSADTYVATIAGATSATYTPPAGLTATTSYRRYTKDGACNTTPTVSVNTWTVTVTPTNTVSTAMLSPQVCLNSPLPVITHTTTGATGIGAITTLPAGVTAAWSANTITISGTPTASGIFNYSIPLTGGCGNMNAIGTITVGGVSTYNGITWVGGTPDIYTTAIFNADYSTSSANITACNCQVEAGKKLTVSPNTSVTIQNNIINNGNIIVESDGNLVQVNDSGTYTGLAANFVVKRNANMKRLDYTYWTSPVKNQNLKTFSPGTVATRFLTYNEGNDLFEVIPPDANIFGNRNNGGYESAAKGYAIRANNNYPVPTATDPKIQIFEGVFKGEPNNGVITFPLQYQSLATGQGFNLIGNPYASNIDFWKLADQNAALIDKKAYFWTNLNPNPVMQGAGYPGTGYVNNYAVLNDVGGIPATTGGPVGGDPKLESITPTEIIKVGQGFIVQAKKAGPLTFNNAVRNTSGASVFFNKGAQATTRDRYWIHLTTPLNVVTTALVGYVQGATDGYDRDYDADLFGLGSDAMFTLLADRRLGIQGKKGPLNTADIVQVGTNHYAAGIHKFSLGNKEGIFANGQNIYLKDRQTGTLTNLSENSYTFTANKGLTEGRFEIVYQPDVVLGTGSAVKESLVVYRDGDDFVVKAQTKKITGIEVYDTAGRLIYTTQPHSIQALIPAEQLVNGVYVLKINQDGQLTSKKIIR
ncbi:PA14 domain-containing protein [Chryseobacterium sp. MDT2-18]|uniref:Ig-like domain-containing protein n=1 Tax=Chryseobacterium sp. MDT2-18 TaxID=1259136 RepID=UPI002786E17F|nr:PA14 domain-containing protein [Chryseobacterium sp. MDT2-18]MDQ0476861.1 hypothetical protein [Chryseobacterium sp. MDT2-18]